MALLAMVALDRGFFTLRRHFVALDVGAWNRREWMQRRALLRAQTQPPRILFLGDSCVAFGIRPSLIDPRALNLARLGLASPDLGELYLKLRTDLKGIPQAVYMGMLWFEFNEVESESSFLEGHPIGLKAVLRDYYERPQLSQQLVFPGTRVLRYGVDKALDFHLKPSGSQVEPDGFGPVDHSRAPEAVAAPPQFRLMNEGWFSPAKMVHLAAFHHHLNTLGIEQTFIFLPMHPQFRKLYRAKFGDDHARWKAAITTLYGGRVLDLEHVLPEVRYYRDATHLNAEGATLLSGLLREHIHAQRPLPTAPTGE